MDRRTTLATLFGQIAATGADNASLVNSGLAPYTGPFEYEQAAHLLRRSMFGPTYQQVKEAVNAGLASTLAQLIAGQPLPEPPLNHYYSEDPFVAVGETWVDAPYTADNFQPIRQYRNQSLRAWTVKVWREEGVSLREKMTLFWHNHFVTADIQDPRFIYKYMTLLRENALGNFRELSKMITIEPSMLRYLNGNENTAVAPNENYARELLELFTIGKGPLAGPGDYTNYTEDDIIEIARVLTGWRDIGFNSSNPAVEPGAVYLPGRHDTGTKQLSHRFDNTVIDNLGDEEYAHLIDVIFTKDECARFICRKLYRWFIYYEISQDVEVNVIEPMAQIMIDNDYEVKPALETLLGSEHFFDMLNVGPMIKNPVDFVMSTVNTLEVDIPESNLEIHYRLLFQLFRLPLELMQMVPYEHPSVAGWKAYYQEPGFYRNWISSSTLPVRVSFTNLMIAQGFVINGERAQIDVLKVAASVDDPFDPNNLIEELSRILYPQPIGQSQKDVLKGLLIPGLPDFEWTVEYGEYINNPTDPNLEAAVASKLRNLLIGMLSMPEFNLS